MKLNRFKLLVRSGAGTYLFFGILGSLGFLFFSITGVKDYLYIGDKEKIYTSLLFLIPSLYFIITTYTAVGNDIIHNNIKRYRGRIRKVEYNRDVRGRGLVSQTIYFTQGKYIDENNQEVKATGPQIFLANYEPFFEILGHSVDVVIEIYYLSKTNIIMDMKFKDGSPAYYGQFSLQRKINLGRGILIMPSIMLAFQYLWFLLAGLSLNATYSKGVISFSAIMIVLYTVIGAVLYRYAGKLENFSKIWWLWITTGVAVCSTLVFAIGASLWIFPNARKYLINNVLLGENIGNEILDLKLACYVGILVISACLFYLKNYPKNPKFVNAFNTYLKLAWRK